MFKKFNKLSTQPEPLELLEPIELFPVHRLLAVSLLPTPLKFWLLSFSSCSYDLRIYTEYSDRVYSTKVIH